MDAMVETPAKRTTRRLAGRLRRLAGRALRVNRLFACIVVTPTVLAILYFGVIAQDVYVSESHLVVRGLQHQSVSSIGTLLQGTGLSGLSPDTNSVYSVQDFLSSRDALEGLEARFPMKKSFGSPTADRISRFDGFGWDDSFEALLRYYQRFVLTTDLDTTSSILTVTVRAFSAEDARAINEALLQMSEELVNRLNERAREDLIRFAQKDVETAERDAKEASLAVSKYRDRKSVFDPEKQSALQLEQIGDLQGELIGTRKMLADVQAVARDNPQIPVLQNRAKVLETEIDAQMSKVAGGRHSLSSQSAEYDAVALERDFAAKRLEIALASLQQSREDAMKEQLYLERVDQPNRPDEAIEPRRIRNTLATFLLSLIVWGVASLLLAAVREHAN